MSFQDPQNPGIGGINEFTDAETLFVQQAAALSYSNGDILYYNNGQLRRLPKGSDTQVLTLASGLPSWASVSSGSGTVTTVSVATANGFAGTVANATTTPAITLTTSITGILKGDGTSISAATAGTDYLTASSSNTLTNKTFDTAGSGNALSIAGVAVTANNGTGAIVRTTSPALVTPALGTPSALVGTNITGTASGLTAGTVTTNANLTGAVTSVGNATSLGSFSSANLISALTDETGSGSAVFGTNPTIAKPVINARNQTAQTYTPAGAGTATLDLSLADQHYITMPAGNITIALSNDTNNQIFYVTTTQDSTGSRTVTWFTTIRWAGGSAPTLTTTANKRDSFIFVRTGSGTYDGFIVGQNI